MQDLTVTIFQSNLAWEDKEKNLSDWDKKINSLTDKTDLIILPEMFTTGFSMNARNLAERAKGAAVTWMKEKASAKNSDIIGSIIFSDKEKIYNRLFWVKPDGRIFTYDKRHLFRMAGEDKVYDPGTEKLVVELMGWKIRPFICYDLRFPIWTRNSRNIYDLAVFVANWPGKRSLHWKTLLQARAIENQAYVIGVNRVGKDGNGILYSGDSSIIDPAGKILFTRTNKEIFFTHVLSFSRLKEYRRDFPVWMDADAFPTAR